MVHRSGVSPRSRRSTPSPAHSLREFPTPTQNSQPEGLVVGPDGALWFVEAATGLIGSLNPETGAVTEYQLPTGQNNPGSIAVGLDGRVWFTQIGTNQIGAINPVTGDINFYSFGNSQSVSNDMTTDSAGDLWLSDFQGADPNQPAWYPKFASYGFMQAILPGPSVSTTIAVSTPAGPMIAGSAGSITAVVTAGSGSPAGTVTFTIDGQPLEPRPVSVVGGATEAILPVSTLAPGLHTVSAAYSGDAQFGSSISALSNVAILTASSASAPTLAPANTAGTVTVDGTKVPVVASSPGGTLFQVSIPQAASNLFYTVYDATNPANPTPLSGGFTSDGVLSVYTTLASDGFHKFAYKSAASQNGVPGPLSKPATILFDGALEVVSVSPADKSFFPSSLPNNRVVVTFNHTIPGLKPDDVTGGGFATNPYAVQLIPRGPTGQFSAPSAIDAGSLTVPATLVYHVNSDGTSTITLTPRSPLGTDVYLIAISGALTDPAGHRLTGNTLSGNFDVTFELRPIPASGAPPAVVSVTTLNASVSINNNTIPQPDTIAIRFNKPLDFLTVNRNSVQLLAGATNAHVSDSVAYSPTTNTIYLTPGAILVPGTVYTVRVSQSVTDDQGFPKPGYPLSATFTTTFRVSPGVPVNQTSPLTVSRTSSGQFAITPGYGVRSTPLGYVSIAFSEPVAMASLGRYSKSCSHASIGRSQRQRLRRCRSSHQRPVGVQSEHRSVDRRADCPHRQRHLPDRLEPHPRRRRNAPDEPRREPAGLQLVPGLGGRDIGRGPRQHDRS